MATIEEQLVAYQIVRSLNGVHTVTLDLAGKMRTAKDDAEAANIKVRAERVITVNEERLTKTREFTEKYPGGPQTLAKGYQWLGVTPKQVSDELDNLVSVKDAAKHALANSNADKEDIVTIGGQIHSGVVGHLPAVVDDELHIEPIQMHVAAWDLVNVIAITLQGLSHGTGNPIAEDSTEKRKRAVERHLKTFGRVEKYLGDSTEEAAFRNAIATVTAALAGSNSTEQLTSLGVVVDAMVPRVPLIRRVWQYGNTVRHNPGP